MIRHDPTLASHVRIFLASFLVLFLQVALIRWMPAYVRLLSYFSNFILLACFLGIGVGCLLALVAAIACSCGFRAIQAAVDRGRVLLPARSRRRREGSIYFTSGTSEPVVPRRDHDAAADRVRRRRGAVRRAGAADGARDGDAAAAVAPIPPTWSAASPASAAFALCLVAGAAADRVVRASAFAAAVPLLRARPGTRRQCALVRPRAIARQPCRCSSCRSPRARAGARLALVAVLPDHVRQAATTRSSRSTTSSTSRWRRSSTRSTSTSGRTRRSGERSRRCWCSAPDRAPTSPPRCGTAPATSTPSRSIRRSSGSAASCTPTSRTPIRASR